MTGGLRLTALYVPGSRPDRFDTAAASGADVVILDLEDAVAPADKGAARSAVFEWVSRRSGGPAVQVRVNAVDTEWFGDDIAMLAELEGYELRLPKVQSVADVAAVTGALGDVPIVALIETALGLERAFEIAGAPGVVALALGDSDLAGDLGSSSPAVLEWARIRLLVASRAAGLAAPMMSVYPAIRDLDGLEADTRRGAELGLVGRTAVHPSQLDPIRRAFAPPSERVAWAEEVMSVLAASANGVARLGSGAMVDAAMSAQADAVLQRAAATRTPGP